MEELIKKIESLKKSDIAKVISKRINEFEENGKKNKEEVFSELCFCLLTANFQAEKCIHIQKELERTRGFSFLPEDKLAEELKKHGHRFPNTRANYIKEARECHTDLCKMLKPNGKEMRKWLVENVKGLGMKEASHFLRNIGYKDIAIIDFHILDLLFKEGFIAEKPKSLAKNQYIEIEKILEKLGVGCGLNLAELDLYLWYIETGKVLK